MSAAIRRLRLRDRSSERRVYRHGELCASGGNCEQDDRDRGELKRHAHERAPQPGDPNAFREPFQKRMDLIGSLYFTSDSRYCRQLQAMFASPPGPTGLYDPRDEHDACGVGFVVDIKGPQVARRHREGPPDPAQPAAPRRLRMRSEYRRRRGRARADAGSVPAEGRRRTSGSPCRPRASTAPGSSSCRETGTSASDCDS